MNTCKGIPPEISPSTNDVPSYLYIGLFILNSCLLGLIENVFLLAPFVVIQVLFLTGMLEVTHQSVHRNFVSHRNINEVLGTLASTLIGFNLIAYRYFHLEHHRHTCDEQDPEGLLYADSPKTKWFFFASPISHVWVAIHINYLARQFVPKNKKQIWNQRRIMMAIIYSVIALFTFVAPQKVIVIYWLPLCLFTFIDFFFSQAEHYGANIKPQENKVAVCEATMDIQLPPFLSYFMLHRSLHSVHHVWPRTRWYESPQRLSYLNQHINNDSLTFPLFFKRWMNEGPRLWPK